MGNDNNKMKEFNHQSTGCRIKNEIEFLQNSFNILQNKLQQLENIDNIGDINSLSIVNIADIITKKVLKHVETTLVQMIDRNTKVNLEISESVCELGKSTACGMSNIEKKMKHLESRLTHKNHVKYLELQENVKQLEKELKHDMKQHQMEMEKINHILECELNINQTLNNQLNQSSNCERMENNHDTRSNQSNKYCTRNRSGTWNNFDKIEYISNKNDFHGKFV